MTAPGYSAVNLEIVKNATTAVEYWKVLAADEPSNITFRTRKSEV